MQPAAPIILTSPYVAEARALFTRFTTTPTMERKALINNLIKSLLLSGVWAKLDAFYVLAAADAQAAQRNWISDVYNLTPVNSPTFTADRGYAGNGIDRELDTGFNPTTASSAKFVLNSASLGVWSRTDVTDSAFFDIGNTSARFNARSAVGNTMRALMNDGTTANFGANGTSVGHFGLNRSASNARQAYYNGAANGSDAQASTALTNANIKLLSGGSNFSTRQLSYGHIGQSLSAGEWAALYNALTIYLSGISGFF